nr:hypothetical protein Iba_chr14aCG5890 [Ipomoea batatas]
MDSECINLYLPFLDIDLKQTGFVQLVFEAAKGLMLSLWIVWEPIVEQSVDKCPSDSNSTSLSMIWLPMPVPSVNTDSFRLWVKGPYCYVYDGYLAAINIHKLHNQALDTWHWTARQQKLGPYGASSSRQTPEPPAPPPLAAHLTPGRHKGSCRPES